MVANTRASFSPEELEAIIRANPDLLKKIFADVRSAHDADKSDQRIISAFQKAGFKDIVLFERHAKGATIRELANDYDVGIATIHRALNGP
jgi:hypothetical protein